MRTRESKRRIAIVTAILLAAVAAGGVITWQNFSSGTEDQTALEETGVSTISEDISDNAMAEKTDGDDEVQPEETMEPDSEETSAGAEGNMGGTEDQTQTAQEQQADNSREAVSENAAEQASANPQITLDFTESTVLQSPVNGQILIPYNMVNTVYFPTLNVYKCNPSVVISAEVGTPVAAVANSQVKSIVNDAQTGLTVTMDMGNGYEAVYGQLQDTGLEEGTLIQAGEIIGTIAEPTIYYSKEGSNLYFKLTKDGQTLDPTLYLPPQEE